MPVGVGRHSYAGSARRGRDREGDCGGVARIAPPFASENSGFASEHSTIRRRLARPHSVDLALRERLSRGARLGSELSSNQLASDPESSAAAYAQAAAEGPRDLGRAKANFTAFGVQVLIL
jgi:hypothetical protein